MIGWSSRTTNKIGRKGQQTLTACRLNASWSLIDPLVVWLLSYRLGIVWCWLASKMAMNRCAPVWFSIWMTNKFQINILFYLIGWNSYWTLLRLSLLIYLHISYYFETGVNHIHQLILFGCVALFFVMFVFIALQWFLALLRFVFIATFSLL